MKRDGPQDDASSSLVPENLVNELRDRTRMLVAAVEATSLLEFGTATALQEAAHHYWEAYTRGWRPRRHARVCLISLLDAERGIAPPPLEALPASAREALERMRRVFHADCPVAAEAPSNIQDRWFAYWMAYPDVARRLSAPEIDRAQRLLRRDLPNKWIELAEFCERIGLGSTGTDPLNGETLAKDWRAWRVLEAGRKIPAGD